jgi:hypothetical protein
VKGVYFDASRDRWATEIKVDKTKIYLGRFLTKEEAAAAYAEASRKYHGEFGRTA